jgi:hypothetical protein
MAQENQSFRENSCYNVTFSITKFIQNVLKMNLCFRFKMARIMGKTTDNKARESYRKVPNKNFHNSLQFLGAFEKLLKAAIKHRHICVPFGLHGTTEPPLDEFS